MYARVDHSTLTLLLLLCPAAALGADDRGGFRTLRQLMEPVIEEMNEDPDEVDEEMRASKNAIYSWKTLRMVARDSLPAFAAAVRKGGDLRVAARALYPDEVPPEPEPEVKVDSEAKPQGTAEGGAAGEGGARPDASADAGEGAGIAVEVEMTEAEDGEADTGAHDSGGNRDEGAGRSGDEGEGAAPSGGDAGGDDPDNEAGVGNEDSEGGALRGEVEASP